MIETRLHTPTLKTDDDASAVMFELQDQPCVHEAGVDLPKRRAWVMHTTMLRGANQGSACDPVVTQSEPTRCVVA